MHADDAVLFASTRNLAIIKLKHLASYCKRNSIILEPYKSNFIAINGNDEDRTSLPIEENKIENNGHIATLGSHISESGNVQDDLKLHVLKRYRACVKFYNFLKCNRNAPLLIKLKVLKSCVMSNLLYNCEAFGPKIPKELKKHYFKLMKAALGVRNNTPNDIILIECGLLALEAIIYARQLKFFKNFKCQLQADSSRDLVFKKLLENCPKYLKHYIDLVAKYNNCNEIYFEHVCKTKQKIRNFAREGNHYRNSIYLKINPLLNPSKFINNLGVGSNIITKFRLGSHMLPIETGRWRRIPRPERLCPYCNDGDEIQFIYSCRMINRSDLNLPPDISNIWDSDDVYRLFQRIYDLDYIV